MKQMTIISGKGGTGKTTLASNFIRLAKNHVAVDADVDASNLYILLKPNILKTQEFIGGPVAYLKSECINCGRCEELCRFDAISDSITDIKFDSLKCEGCGVCEYICPADAIGLKAEKQGEYYISDTVFGKFVHARLDPGAENSGKLVTIVRNIAEDLVYRENKDLIIIDAAPGIGCSVIASLNGVDLAVIMIEPTLSGISDFLKIYDVVKFFGIKPFVVINKKDLNEDNRQKIIKFCNSANTEIIGEIPYDERIPFNLANNTFAVDDTESIAGKEIKNIWEKIMSSEL